MYSSVMLSTSTLYTIYSFKFLAFKNRTKVSFPLPPSLSCNKADIPQYLCWTGVVYLEHKSWLQISDDNVWWQGELGWDLTAHKSLSGHSSVFQELRLRLISSSWLTKTSTNFRHIYFYGWGMECVGGQKGGENSSK